MGKTNIFFIETIIIGIFGGYNVTSFYSLEGSGLTQDPLATKSDQDVTE